MFISILPGDAFSWNLRMKVVCETHYLSILKELEKVAVVYHTDVAEVLFQ